MKIKGIDISNWQGKFDLAKAKTEGVEFLIAKGGGGDAGLYKDKQFERNYSEAKKLGLPVGVYWFSHALNVNEAVKEAEFFYNNCLKGKQFELPIFIDVEHKSQLALGKDKLTEVITTFLSTLESIGFWVGIYSSKAYFAEYMHDDKLQKYTHWVAQWSKRCTYKGNEGVLGFWQYGGETNAICSTQIAGQTIDQNYMLQDYPTLIKQAKKNGFQYNAQSIPKKSLAEIALEVINGEWGNGTARRLKLEKAGHNYKAVQDEVNQLFKLANEVLRGEWGNGKEREALLTGAGFNYGIVQTVVNMMSR